MEQCDEKKATVGKLQQQYLRCESKRSGVLQTSRIFRNMNEENVTNLKCSLQRAFESVEDNLKHWKELDVKLGN